MSLCEGKDGRYNDNDKDIRTGAPSGSSRETGLPGETGPCPWYESGKTLADGKLTGVDTERP